MRTPSNLITQSPSFSQTCCSQETGSHWEKNILPSFGSILGPSVKAMTWCGIRVLVLYCGGSLAPNVLGQQSVFPRSRALSWRIFENKTTLSTTNTLFKLVWIHLGTGNSQCGSWYFSVNLLRQKGVSRPKSRAPWNFPGIPAQYGKLSQRLSNWKVDNWWL